MALESEPQPFSEKLEDLIERTHKVIPEGKKRQAEADALMDKYLAFESGLEAKGMDCVLADLVKDKESLEEKIETINSSMKVLFETSVKIINLCQRSGLGLDDDRVDVIKEFVTYYEIENGLFGDY